LIFFSSTDAKAKEFEVMPGLAKIYNSADFEVFYVKEAEATFYSMKGESKTIKL